MTSAPSVTVVIPVYNEVDIIARTLLTLTAFLGESRFPYPYRILVVDNASTDGTGAAVTAFAAAHSETSLLSLPEKGKGRAIRAGWEEAGGDVLCFMDADLSSDIASFRPLVEAVVSGSVDISIGNRLGRRSKIVSTKNFRKFASRVYNAMARVFLGTGIDDHQCGFKAISRRAFVALSGEITETGFFFDTELIALARTHGLRIHEEDIVWIDSPSSKVSFFSDSLKMFAAIIKLAWRLRI